MCSSRYAFDPRLEFDLDVGLDKLEGCGTRLELATRPLPIEARLIPEGAGVGVGGKVAPRETELRDSLRRRLPRVRVGRTQNKKMQTKFKIKICKK